MVKEITLWEFKKYYKDRPIERIAFLTENQSWYDIRLPFKVELHFPRMKIFETLDTIKLESETGALYLRHIEHIKIDTESLAIVSAAEVTVYCWDIGYEKSKVKYTLVIV